MAVATHLLIASLMLPAGPASGQVSRPAGKAGPLFATSDQCMACHNGLITRAGQDVSIGVDWRASMMANAARDPYWQAGVRREVLDHPHAQAEIENECAACHMPMARYEAKAQGRLGTIFAHLPVGHSGKREDLLAADGVSCTVCHQIENEGLGTRESFTGGFRVDPLAPEGRRRIFGPVVVDRGRQTIMRSVTGFQPEQGMHIQRSELCASCHTLITHAFGPDGKVVGELPEQVPYQEWRHSQYADSQSCQDCHMPAVQGNVLISSVLGEAREKLSKHVFLAGNFLMPLILNRYRNELGVEAQPQELDLASQHTIAHLQSQAARVSIENARIVSGRLQAEVVIENLAGHKLPTAYPSRRAWIHLRVRDGQGRSVFESGAFRPDGSIAGNDNDTDPARFEPHYEEVSGADQVQIYESVLADHAGRVTTGLLWGVRYIKDNRLLPLGFDKTTADAEIAVHGAAGGDADFRAGGDRVRYSVSIGGAAGPFSIEAELWYQPIAYRWAQNLRLQRAMETDRFFDMYNSMADHSAIVVARASASAR
jgi:hypothetical protein